MKLKFFYLGLLSTLVIASQTNGADDKYKRRAAAPEQLRVHEHVAAQVEPHLNVGHHHDPLVAMGDIVKKTGEALAPAVANHAAVRALNGNANLHERIDDALATLGPVTRAAVDDGVGVAIVRGNPAAPADIMPSINERLDAVLQRLRDGMHATRAAGHHLRTVAATDKGVVTGAGADTVNGNEDAAIAATNIEAFLNAVGW